MSQAETDSPPSSRSLYLALSLGGTVLVLALLVWLVLQPVPKRPVKAGTENPENPLVQARQALARDTDINTCRTALQEINQHLGQQSEPNPSLQPQHPNEIRQLFGLDDTAINELRNTSFTMLDGQHLDQCFLMRDAALSIQVGGLPVQPSPVEQATTAFAWTMHQVRLVDHDPPVAPPSYVLRRGWGSALERALVFLALLQQVAPPTEMQGCLVYCPVKKDGPQRFWACGVVVAGTTDVHLFDPRLGLPLPGPRGKGVATLTGVAKDPTLLSQLNVNDTDRYDVTPDLASAAQLQLVCSLSALSGRMRYLQDKLLAPSIHVQLAVNPLEERDRLEQAAGKGRVQVWQEPTKEGPALNGPELLRRFLPPEEGGLDLDHRFQEFIHSLVPLNEMPAMFRDEQRFPRSVGLAQQVQLRFAIPFVNSVTDPQKPRNLILRGRFSKAAKELENEKELINMQVQQRNAQPNLEARTNEWSRAMFALYADLQRARGNAPEQEKIKREIDDMWTTKSTALALLLHAATAPARSAEVKYLLGQSKHDQAEQLQTRLEVETRARLTINDTDRRDRETAWQDALNVWKSYLEEYPHHAGNQMARQLRARALVMLGQWEEAATEWENLPVKGLEKVAAVYMAKQIRNPKSEIRNR